MNYLSLKTTINSSLQNEREVESIPVIMGSIQLDSCNTVPLYQLDVPN